MFISAERFKVVLDSTPLVSIDLIIENDAGEFLLGLRKNRPAQSYWFVPGGRIQKNESLAAAFKRLTFQEIGLEIEIDQAELLGLYDHFYDDSVFGDDITTHYVAIAYKLKVHRLSSLPDTQHSEYQWFNMAELFSDPKVHPNTKNYF